MIKSLYLCICFTIACFSLSMSSPSNPNNKKILDSLFNIIEKQKQFSGEVLVAEKGEVIFHKAFGECPEHAQYDIGSIAKTFVAASIMLLQNEKKLDINNSVNNYIKTFPYQTISIKNLLNHTSGLPDYMNYFTTEWDKSKIATSKDVLNYLINKKPALDFNPGENWKYSNTGYVILSLIIENVTNKTFQEFLQDKLFRKYNLNNTKVYATTKNKIYKNQCLGLVYSIQENQYIQAKELEKWSWVNYIKGITGDGMTLSTAEDLFKWDRLLYTNKLFDTKTKNFIFSPTITPNGTHNYGIGWQLSQSDELGHVVSHSGAYPGYITYFTRFIDVDKTIIVLSNKESDSVLKIKSMIDDVLSERTFKIPKQSIIEKISTLISDTLQLKNNFYILIKDKENYYLNESELNKFSNSLIKHNKIFAASVMYTIYTQQYPNSYIGFEGLALVEEKKGNLKEALYYAKKALELKQ